MLFFTSLNLLSPDKLKSVKRKIISGIQPAGRSQHFCALDATEEARAMYVFDSSKNVCKAVAYKKNFKESTRPKVKKLGAQQVKC